MAREEDAKIVDKETQDLEKMFQEFEEIVEISKIARENFNTSLKDIGARIVTSTRENHRALEAQEKDLELRISQLKQGNIENHAEQAEQEKDLNLLKLELKQDDKENHIEQEAQEADINLFESELKQEDKESHIEQEEQKTGFKLRISQLIQGFIENYRGHKSFKSYLRQADKEIRKNEILELKVLKLMVEYGNLVNVRTSQILEDAKQKEAERGQIELSQRVEQEIDQLQSKTR